MRLWLILFNIFMLSCIGICQRVTNGDFNQFDTIVNVLSPMDSIPADTVYRAQDVRQTEWVTLHMDDKGECHSSPACIVFSPFSIAYGGISSSCLMLELDRPMVVGKLYTITVQIKPICAYRSYPPHPKFGIKLSDISIAETPYTRILGSGWRTALDTIPGTIRYFDPKALRCEAKDSFTCPDWEKYDFDIVATRGERYIYLSVFGEIPATNLWDDQKKIRRLVHQFDRGHSAKRSSKAMSKLRTYFPWPPDEVSNIELAFFASTWGYQAITDATYLIDDVSITIKE